MQQPSLTRREVSLIMTDLHARLIRLGTSSLELRPHRGLCVQLILASTDPLWVTAVPNYRDKRRQVVSDLMRGWVRRNPHLGRAAKRRACNLLYPILPASALRNAPAHLTEEHTAIRLYTSVSAWGDYMEVPENLRGPWPPTKPQEYEEFIAARLHLLQYLRVTVSRAIVRFATQEASA